MLNVFPAFSKQCTTIPAAIFIEHACRPHNHTIINHGAWAKLTYTMYIQYLKKEQKQKISSRNLARVGMAGWRHWLTKYRNKESTFHNIATLTSHNYTYMSSSDTLVSMFVHCYLCRDGCVKSVQQCCGMCSKAGRY